MLRSNERDRELSKSLRKLVCESIGKELQGVAWQRTHGSADKREIPVKYQNIGEGLDEFQGEDEHCWKERCAMLDSRKSEMLAANLLERLQIYATITFQKPIFDEQGNWRRRRDEARFDSRD